MLNASPSSSSGVDMIQTERINNTVGSEIYIKIRTLKLNKLGCHRKISERSKFMPQKLIISKLRPDPQAQIEKRRA